MEYSGQLLTGSHNPQGKDMPVPTGCEVGWASEPFWSWW